MIRVARAALFLLLAWSGCAEPPRTVCRGDDGPVVDAPTVCAHLVDLGCRIDGDDAVEAEVECANAYEAMRVARDPATFARLTRCYGAATSCSAVAVCSLACVDTEVDAGTDADVEAGVDAGDTVDAASDAAGSGDAEVDAGVDAGP